MLLLLLLLLLRVLLLMLMIKPSLFIRIWMIGIIHASTRNKPSTHMQRVLIARRRRKRRSATNTAPSSIYTRG